MKGFIKRFLTDSKKSGLRFNFNKNALEGAKLEILDLIPEIVTQKYNTTEGNFNVILKQVLDYSNELILQDNFMVVDDVNEKDNVHVRVALTREDLVIMNIFRFSEYDYKMYFIAHNADVKRAKALYYQHLIAYLGKLGV